VIEAVLLDMDDTLVHNDMVDFIPAYYALLREDLADLLPQEELMRRMSQGVEQMFLNDGAGRTNLEAFMDLFMEGLDYSEEEMEARFDAFYRDRFHLLESHTRKKPQARAVVEEAFRQGYRVVIATQPLFPRIAIDMRLDWAGVGDFLYDLVTTAEVSYACKPHPAYYQAIADHLGLAPEACLMAGDSVRDDLPAAALGMRTFWVTDSLDAEAIAQGPAEQAQGGLTDLQALLAGDLLR
jgi:HAD superfamily hydrolase (TIGR01549 family)